MQVAIIGAGISGLYLALKLAEMGHRVVVFERRGEIGNRACSGLFSERILEYIPQSKDLVLNKIKHAFINFPKKTVKLNFSKEFLVMSHYELDRLAADLAKKAGVEIVLNNNISRIPEGFDRVIGCDGPLSFVRKELGLKEPSFRLGILGFVSKKSSEDFVETWPVKECLPAGRQGFIWKIPRGENTEYGIMAGLNEAKDLLEEFSSKNNLVLDDLQSKIIPHGLILPNNEKITLAGDATGLTKPWSGGGVVWQMELANILLKAFPDFKEYSKQAEKVFGFKLLAGKVATNLVYSLGFNFPWILPSRANMESDFLVMKKGRRI